MPKLDLFDCDRCRLSPDTALEDFDCGCPDLNDFILNDALNYSNQLLATTFIYYHLNEPVAFVSYLNDKISYGEGVNWNNISRRIPNAKRHRSSGYPAVKIGRLGVRSDLQGAGLGGQILDFSKAWFLDDNKTGCRFITLDAYNTEDVVEFYRKNGFKLLQNRRKENRTVLMYFDLMTLKA